MKTDALFYELFRRWPGVALQLAGSIRRWRITTSLEPKK